MSSAMDNRMASSGWRIRERTSYISFFFWEVEVATSQKLKRRCIGRKKSYRKKWQIAKYSCFKYKNVIKLIRLNSQIYLFCKVRARTTIPLFINHRLTSLQLAKSLYTELSLFSSDKLELQLILVPLEPELHCPTRKIAVLHPKNCWKLDDDDVIRQEICHIMERQVIDQESGKFFVVLRPVQVNLQRTLEANNDYHLPPSYVYFHMPQDLKKTIVTSAIAFFVYSILMHCLQQIPHLENIKEEFTNPNGHVKKKFNTFMILSKKEGHDGAGLSHTSRRDASSCICIV